MPILGEMAKALGSGCGTVDSAVISETRWTGFESNHQQLLLYIFNVYRKDETKEKEAGNDPFEKDCQKQDRLDSQNAFVAKIRTYVEKFSFSCKLNISVRAWHFSFLMAKYQFLSLSLFAITTISVFRRPMTSWVSRSQILQIKDRLSIEWELWGYPWWRGMQQLWRNSKTCSKHVHDQLLPGFAH